MSNIRLKIQYDGTDYSGWQVQPDERTIEVEITGAIGKILQRKVKVTGASRTDAGVHARGQVANFSVDREVDTVVLKRSLNAVLPPDISVQTADMVPDDFHSRFDSKGKIYHYYIWNRDYKSPFYSRFSWHLRYAIDMDGMNKAASMLSGEKDFSSFRGSGCDSSSSVRRIDFIDAVRDGGFIRFTVEGSGFLKHMVRNIVGTLVEVGVGRMSPEKMPEILEGRDRRLAGPTAPAQGLVLVRVKY